MFDFLRNLGRSGEVSQQEALSAYLDNELAPADHDRLQQQLASDSRLQDELVEMQAWQQQMRSLPQRRVPRNFTLDPALYGRPQRQPMTRVYPVLRTATAFTAILLVVALAANVFLGQSTTMMAPQAPEMSMAEMTIEEAPLAGAVAQDEAQMAVEEVPLAGAEVQEEAQMAAEEAPLADVAVQEEAEVAAEEPAESFLLEQSALEMEPAEAPSDFATETELLPQGTPSLSPALEIVEPTALPEAANDGETALSRESIESLPQAESAAADAEMADAAPQPQSAPKLPEPPAAAAELPPESASTMPALFSPLVMALAALFLVLMVLTLLARGRR